MASVEAKKAATGMVNNEGGTRVPKAEMAASITVV